MTTPPLGVDIYKLKFDACLVRDGGKLRHKVFPNSPAGFAQRSAWLAKHQVERAHACLEATGTYGEALITRAEGLIRSHIDAHPGLRAQRDLLLSIPGIGETTAAKLLGEIMDVKLYAGARQLAAFAGLAPRLHESGSSVWRKARLSKAGRRDCARRSTSRRSSPSGTTLTSKT